MARRTITLLLLFSLASIPISSGVREARGAEFTCGPSDFARDLFFGSSGTDVKTLQQFLNHQGSAVATTGPGSPGRETTYFGRATRDAVIRFQKTHGISPAAGYFGPKSRAKASALCTVEGTVPVVPPIVIGTTPPPAVIPPVATSTPAATSTVGINPRSIVGVICYYRMPGDDIRIIKGTGVIVHPEGYVLTAKHAVDPRWTRAMYDDTLTEGQKEFYGAALLEYCEIGAPESLATLPEEPHLITRYFQYRAMPYFLPDRTGLSDMEFKNADFAILRITDTAPNCAGNNRYCTEFDHFPYSLAGTTLPMTGHDVAITYGYPGGEGTLRNAFLLSGASGTIPYYLSGNERFEGKPFSFSLRAPDIKTGRSGSPVFFKDRIIGLLYGSVSESEAYNLAIGVIRTILNDHGLGWVLKTQ